MDNVKGDNMVHPHIKSIEKMNPAQLIGIMEESRICFIQENLNLAIPY